MQSKRISMLIASLLLTGCVTAPNPENGVWVTWERMQSNTAYVVERGKIYSGKGFARREGNKCHIRAPDTQIKVVNGKRTFDPKELQTLGEELKHCFDGSFHD